ncbi:hypothetical protein TNIN_500961 [Trichonephila inaurata madagascariensis]|uniref:Uncharacterized protein n=1 Tax=Trichonephila inaurata madagascariensis TaxID=2747483 RepID=A0A8X6WXA4_9ARAC|nr:hypothetical protein TNIN_500961 [Trichonephila inaurata madagascariensis]
MNTGCDTDSLEGELWGVYILRAIDYTPFCSGVLERNITVFAKTLDKEGGVLYWRMAELRKLNTYYRGEFWLVFYIGLAEIQSRFFTLERKEFVCLNPRTQRMFGA